MRLFMSFTAIVSGIFAIASAVPKIMSLIGMISDKYVNLKVTEIKNTYNLKQNKLSVLKKMLKEARTDEELITLSLVIHDINKL